MGCCSATAYPSSRAACCWETECFWETECSWVMGCYLETAYSSAMECCSETAFHNPTRLKYTATRLRACTRYRKSSSFLAVAQDIAMRESVESAWSEAESMCSSALVEQKIAMAFEPPPATTMPLKVQPLTAGDEIEVLAFLSARPIHTVFISGFIHDNGLESPLNRGTFFGCRNGEGKLEGVALIGHCTLVEARTESALESFAHLTQDCPSAHMILGEEEKVAAFWTYFAQAGLTPRRACRQVL